MINSSFHAVRSGTRFALRGNIFSSALFAQVSRNAHLSPRLAIKRQQRLLSGHEADNHDSSNGLSEALARQMKGAEQHILTEAEHSAIMDGTYNWEHITESRRNKIIIREYVAPHCGVIKVIALNDRSSSNAIDREMLRELTEEIDAIHLELEPGRTRVLVIASAIDRSFCSGANLKERANMTLEETNEFLANLRATFTSIENLPIPSISAVHGAAFGGGMELALCTSLRFCASNALFGLPETHLGIIPGAGGTYRLQALVGRSNAMDMIVGRKFFTGKEAKEIGLVTSWIPHKVITDTPADTIEAQSRLAVLQSCMFKAGITALGAPLANRAALQAIQGNSQEAENKAYDTIVRTDDRNAALVAFKAKTRPVFKGS